MVGGADHIGGAFPPRPRQRVEAGRAHDLGDLVGRNKTRQRRRGSRWRSRCWRRLRRSGRNGRSRQAHGQRGSPKNASPHGPNPLAPARGRVTPRLCPIGAALGRPLSRGEIFAAAYPPRKRARIKTAARPGTASLAVSREEGTRPITRNATRRFHRRRSRFPNRSAQTKSPIAKQAARIEHRQKSRKTAHTPSAGLRSFTELFIGLGATRRTRWPNPGYTRSPVIPRAATTGS